MLVVARLRSLWRHLVRRRGAEAELDEELHGYTDLLTAEHERRGLSPAAARRAALVEIGGIEQVKEASRDAWAGAAFSSAMREFRYALRSLAHSPAYVVIAVLTLGIGIGGATAVFTVVNGTLLRPLPVVTAPDRLVDVEIRLPSGTLNEMSWPDFVDLRDHTHTLTGLAVHNGTAVDVTGAGLSTRAMVDYVSGDFFRVLGVHPALGRLLGRADVVPHALTPVVVVSYAFWQGQLGGMHDVVGRRLDLNGTPLTIVGVAPKGFIGAMNLYPMDLWIPVTMLQPILHMSDPLARRGDGWFRAIGRLAPGRTVAQAQQELATVMAGLAATYPEDVGRSVRVAGGAGLASYDRADLVRLPVLLGVAVAVLLLIACANVSTLTLVRASARRRELATRLALGASRRSLAGRLMLEGTLIATGAALLGIGLARVLVSSTALVHSIVAMPDPDLALDPRVLFVSVAAAGLTAVLVSLVPIVQIAHVPVDAVLKDGAAGAVRRRSRTQRVLVAGQLAASLMLLGASAVVFDAVSRMLAADPGFDPRGVSALFLTPQNSGLDSTRQRAFYAAVLARAEARPDIAAAALTTTVPPQEWSLRSAVFRAEDVPSRQEYAGHDLEFPVRAYIDEISPALFAVLRIPLLRGRTFSEADDADAPRVVIVSRRLADALWPGQNPLGKLLAWPDDDGRSHQTLRVVGVAADTRHASLADAEPPYVMYVPYAQEPVGNMSLLVRTRTGAAPSRAELRQIVGAAVPGVTTRTARPVKDVIDDSLAPQRRAAAWIGAFGIIALLLAAVGLYGVISQGVLQRTRELAVRAALGASPQRAAALVVGEGLRLATVGVIAGTAGCVVGIRVLGAELDGIRGLDLRAIAVAAVILVATALGASMIPARRASRLDSMRALRAD